MTLLTNTYKRCASYLRQQNKRRRLLSDSDDSDEVDLSNLKEAANAAVPGAGDTVDLPSDKDKDKILGADESDNSDVENNNAEENQAVEDDDFNDEEVSEGEDAFEDNEEKEKQEHNAMGIVV